MKLPAIPVDSFEDATLNAEKLQDVLTTPEAALPFLQLLKAGQVAVAYGGGSVTFTASVTSAPTSVTHSIGRVPQIVLATSATTNAIPMLVVSATASTATLRGEYWASLTGTYPFNWLAIG